MNEPARPADMQAQIAAMVAGQTTRVGASVSRVGISGDTMGGMAVTGTRDPATGVMSTTIRQLSKPTAPPSDRVADDGRDLRASAQQLKSELTKLETQLNEHKFDPATGQKLYTLAPGSAARQSVEARLNQMRQTTAHQLAVFQKIEAQRAADAQAREETRLVEAFTLGDKRREAMLNEEVERERARQLAKRIVNGGK
jgi:hypothetical protein